MTGDTTLRTAPARTGLRSRLAEAVPPLAQALAGAPAWGLLMAASAAASLWLRDWQTPGLFWTVSVLFAVGGALAFAPGLFAARLFGLGRGREVAFAAAFLSMSVMTIGVTALVFAVIYRSYYAQWHADTFSLTWTFQLVFTTAGAVAQFAALGVRMYFPLGFAALLAFSLAFSLRFSGSIPGRAR